MHSFVSSRPATRFLGVVACLLSLAVAASASGGKRVLGKLGQALRDVGIHSRMSDGSHVYYHTKQYEYLVVNQTRSAAWTSVVLQNGSKGYIPADSVAVLPYNVLQTAPGGRRSGDLSSRSSGRTGDLASRNDSIGTTQAPGDVAGLATEFIGTPYKWGGQDLQSGIDCSGFVKKMFGAIGVNLPRTAAFEVNTSDDAVTALPKAPNIGR